MERMRRSSSIYMVSQKSKHCLRDDNFVASKATEEIKSSNERASPRKFSGT